MSEDKHHPQSEWHSSNLPGPRAVGMLVGAVALIAILVSLVVHFG